MDLSSFLTSLGTSFLVFFILMLLFTWLSRKPGNKVVYYPIRLLKPKGMEPLEAEGGRRSGRKWFAWVQEAMGATEQDVVAVAGVDAAVYLLFESTALKILALSGVVLLPVLLPIAGTGNNIAKVNEDAVGVTFNDIETLAMGNIKEQSPRLWAFLIGTYWVTFVTFFMLWKAYKHVSDLRAAAKAGEGVRPEDFAILVRDIPPVPKGQTRQEQVDSYFRALYPNTFYKSMVITDNKQANTIWNELNIYKRTLARAVFEESKTTDEPDGTRPENATGFLGITGAKVEPRIKELLSKLKAEQELTMSEKQQAAALVFFNNRSTAVAASQTLHAQMTDTWTVTEAPEPRQLIWSNLTMKTYERQIRQCIAYGVVFFTVAFYMIPITLISAFTTLDNLKKILPFLKKLVDQRAAKTLLEAYLPQTSLIVFLAVLPRLLMFLSEFEGIPSKSHVVRAASGKYFYFIIFNVFLGVTIGGTLFTSLKSVVNSPGLIIPMLGGSLPGNATFFLTFVALKISIGNGLELSRILPLIKYHLRRKYLCKSKDEERRVWAPTDFRYGTRVPNDILIMAICLCYSVIAPLIIPFGIVYFGLKWLILRNQALKVYVPTYESNGRMWPHMHKRIIATLTIYHITMFGYFGIKKFFYAPFLIPLPIMTSIFSHICHNRFYLSFFHTPLEVACRNVEETPNMESIYRAYIPPCLRPQRIRRRRNNQKEKNDDDDTAESSDDGSVDDQDDHDANIFSAKLCC